MNRAHHVLGIDIGGSSIKAAPVDTESGSMVSEPYVFSLPASATPQVVGKAFREIVAHFTWSDVIGCGYPGVIKRGVACSAANVSPDWLNVNIENLLGDAAGCPVTVLNDADAAGLAEMKFGAGREHNHESGGTVLIVTLGTGIGTAFFHNGRLFPNTEFGHVYMSNGIEAEVLAAGSIRTREDLPWDVWAKRVDDYLKEMNKLVSPELIVIGGGVSENFNRFQCYLTVPVKTVPAQMGNDAGIVGAALVVTRM